MEFHAGMRLGVVIQYLKMNQVEFSNFVDVGQPTVSRWLSLKSFSQLIITKLHPLEGKGINIEYFVHKEQPMLVSQKQLTLKQQQEEIKRLQIKIKEVEKKLEDCEKRNNRG